MCGIVISIVGGIGSGAVSGTGRDTASDTVSDTVSGTLSDTVGGTGRDTASDTVSDTVSGTVSDTIGDTVSSITKTKLAESKALNFAVDPAFCYIFFAFTDYFLRLQVYRPHFLMPEENKMCFIPHFARNYRCKSVLLSTLHPFSQTNKAHLPHFLIFR